MSGGAGPGDTDKKSGSALMRGPALIAHLNTEGQGFEP